MRRFPVWAMFIALAAIAGCQTNMQRPAAPQGNCSHRPFDAGKCDQPTNFRLFDYLIGADR